MRSDCKFGNTNTKGCMGRGCKEDRHAGDGTGAHKLLRFCGDGGGQSGLGAYVSKGQNNVSLDCAAASIIVVIVSLIFCACNCDDIWQSL